MKIFITGVAGFLGSHLADKLLDLGHAVHGNDNFLGGFRRNINHLSYHRRACIIHGRV